jgi:opacity protein-like surface antigen
VPGRAASHKEGMETNRTAGTNSNGEEDRHGRCGGAWSGVEVTVWDPPVPATTAHHKRTLTGWTAGAGWEYALGYGWSWKSEFLYIDYGLQRFFDPADTCSPNCAFFVNPRDVSLKNYVFRTGLNWRFRLAADS